MKIFLATTTALALAVLSAAGANVDANHPDLSDLSDKSDYDQNPAWYSKGWHDGWLWASALADKTQTYSDTCEGICRKRYGDIDQEDSKARTKFLGFLAAAAFVREHAEGVADNLERGTHQKRASDNSLERAIDAEERTIGAQGRDTDKERAPDNNLEPATDTQKQAGDATTRTRPTPAADDWDACPGGWVTEEAIKQLVSDPNTCKFDSATAPQPAEYNGKKCWLVVVQFRTGNSGVGEAIGVADVYMVGSDPLLILDARLRE
jgi:hypothetical protein